MSKSKKSAASYKKGYNRLGMLVIAFIVSLLLGSLMMQSQTLKNRLAGYDAKAAELEESIENEKERTKEIDELKKHMQTDEYAEEIARERLGLVKDNEIVFRVEE